MPDLQQSKLRNRLLQALPADDFALLAPSLVACQAKKHDVLFYTGAPIQNVWFLECGIGSLVTVSSRGEQAESGLFGRDGFAPASLALGDDKVPYQGVIQVSDECFRLGADVLKGAMRESRTLHALLLRYVQALHVQTTYTALFNAVHPVNQRLARWLLMCHDRIDGDELSLTHDYMSDMLAVRRPSVTTALHVLEGEGYVRVKRGRIIIRNRAGLEAFSGDGYGSPEREYERLIGPLR